MAKIVSVINLKGGVAKTTTTVQLAECLASEFSKRVLVIDLDPQTNATIALISEEKWEELDSNRQTLYHLFNDKLQETNLFDLSKAIQKRVSNLHIPNLDLLASNIRFIDIQDRLGEISDKTSHTQGPMEILKPEISRIKSNYDYILIDCPPNLGFITQNGIEISDYYLIPSISDTLSTYGIPQIVKKIHSLKSKRTLNIECLGLVITKFDSRSSSHERGRRDLPTRFEKIFADMHIPSSPVFQTIMPQANAIAEAMEYSNTPSTFREKYGRSRSGDRYLYEYVIDLTKEFIKYVQ